MRIFRRNPDWFGFRAKPFMTAWCPALVLAAITAAVPAAPSRAASVCTDVVKFQKPDGCLDNVFNRTSVAGLDATPVGDSYYFWFGTDVVVARCVRPGETQVVLFSYHQKSDQACPLTKRPKDEAE